MSNNDIHSQIAELEACLAQPLPEAARRLVEQQLATLRQQHAALLDLSNAQTGDISVGDVAGRDVLKGAVDVSGAVQGAAVGVNQGVVINASTLSPSPDATQLRLLRAIAEQAGVEFVPVGRTSPIAMELGRPFQEVTNDLAILGSVRWFSR